MTTIINRGRRSLDTITVHQLRDSTFRISDCAKGLLTNRELERLNIEDVAMTGSISKLASFATWVTPSPHSSWDEIKGVGSETFARHVMVASHQFLQDWDGPNESPESVLRSDVMILGVNAGSGGANIDWEDFMIFHDNITGGHKPSTVHKYLPYILDTRMSGAYMTDAFKGLPTANARDLMRHFISVAEDLGYGSSLRTTRVADFVDRVLTLFARVLDVEMSILGVPNMFVIMGSKNSIIKDVIDRSELIPQLDEGFVPVAYLPHSGNAISDANIQKSLSDIDGYMSTLGIPK